MANFPKLKLTNAGLNLLTNVQAGADDLVFTKAALGNGELSTPLAGLTALVSPKIEVDITEGKKVSTTSYQIGAFFSNEDITTGFWWREIGVFAKGKDGNEILYAYSNAGDAGDYIPIGSDERVEKYIYLSLAIGNAESVTVEIGASDTFIPATEKGQAGGIAPLGEDGKIPAEYLQTDEEMVALIDNMSKTLTEHTANKANPHGVTATQVGLGNVPNVATNDQTPTYTEASTLATLTSGEKLGIAFGKIKKAITDLIAHIADTTKHITSAERTAWNGKAPTSHASTATTYGVGNSSNYGHLKITDSLTSTATDTAISAKAAKSLNEKVVDSGWTLLKTQSVSLITSEASNTASVELTGVDFNAYTEYDVIVDGTFTEENTGANGRTHRLVLGYNTTWTSGVRVCDHSRQSYDKEKYTTNVHTHIRLISQYLQSTIDYDDSVNTVKKYYELCTGLQTAEPLKYLFIQDYTASNTTTFIGTVSVYARGGVK